MNYINLLPSTLFTKGINRSVIIDVEKSIYAIIPNSLFDVFNTNKQFKLDKVLKSLSFENKDIFIEYVNFLEDNNFILKSENRIKFKYYDNDLYHIRFDLETLIFDSISFSKFKLLFNKIDVHVEYLQLRFFCDLNLKELENIFEILIEKKTSNNELVFFYNSSIEEEQYLNLFDKYFDFFSRIIIMNYETNKTFKSNKLYFSKNKLLDEKSCGLVTTNLFMPNLRTVLNSKHNNSCLNKKISIDKDGNIKNCPSMPQSFGNIEDTGLKDALNHPDFKKYWNVTKDMVEVCKDCEFRHICTDCRAYTERTTFDNDIDLSKPLKCGYNPYTNEWAEWSTNPLKEKAIEYYGMEDLVKKENY